MNTLFFNTETTGLVRDKLPPTDPKQPMAVQLGMKLDGPNRVERGAVNLMVRPEGWEVNPKAAEITGIDNAVATAFGTHLITAVELFLDYVDHADVIVAHNARFDITVMRRMTQVWSEFTGEPYRDPFDGKTLICTMLATTPLLKLTPKRYGDYKWPKLEECVRYYWNESLDGAHDALVDVRATARVYYHLLDEGVFAADADTQMRL